MKYVKMLGLAAMAAMALMAFGAGTASAAKTLTSTGVKLNAPVTIHATLEAGTSALLSTTDSKTLVDTCKVSTVEGTTTNSDTPITGHIEILSWGEPADCSVTTDTLTKGDLTIHEDGTVTGAGSVVTVNFSGVSCRYGTGTGTDLGKLETGKLAINAVINEQEPKAFLCPDTTRWVANYTVTSPHDLSLG